MPHPWRRVLRAGPPSIPAVLFITLAVCVPIVLQQPMLNSDGDLARHLRHGRYMLEHGGLIRTDPFSYTRAGAPFVGFEYGSQVMYALAERVGGVAGVTILAGLLIGLTYALLAGFLLRRGVEPALALLATILAAAVGAGHWLARPHLISFIAVVLLMELLERPPRRPILPFAVLFVIWANMHGGFAYGWILVGLYLVGSAGEVLLNRERAEWLARTRYYATALVAAVGATLLNPRGLALHRHLFDHLNQRYLFDYTDEFTSPNFHELGAKLFLAVLLICIAALSLRRTRPTIPHLLVICAGTAFALIAARNMSLFGLTAVPLVALHVDSAWRRLPDGWGVRGRFEATARRAATLVWTVPATVVMLVLAYGHGRVGSAQLISDQFDPAVFPMAAVQQARSHRLQGRLFTEFTWGGYVDYAWPEQKIFIDGGTDFFGEEIFREYQRIMSLSPGWREVVKKWDISLMMLSSRSPLAHELPRDGRWQPWYCDSLTVILRRSDNTTAMTPAAADSAEHTIESCAATPVRISVFNGMKRHQSVDLERNRRR